MIPTSSFAIAATAAAEPAAAVSSEQTPTASGQSEVTPGLLQRWFPGWTGWYGYSSSQPATTVESPSTSSEASFVVAGEDGVLDVSRSNSDASIGSDIPIAKKTEFGES